jgi:hypothetical protein
LLPIIAPGAIPPSAQALRARSACGQARKARRPHARAGGNPGPIASLTALDDADPDAARITEILDAIPGAWRRTQEGRAQAARGEGTPLDELA